MDPAYGNKDPGGSDVKESACNAGDLGFNLWVGKIPRRREWQPTPVFFPREFHGQRSLAGCSPWGHKESDTTEQLTHIHTQEIYRNDNKHPPLGSRGWPLCHTGFLSLSHLTHTCKHFAQHLLLRLASLRTQIPRHRTVHLYHM